jgi:exopolyphosphatase / guanosine-5'-triphosphate,3'-diphosphate pyrophosphatase
LRLVVPQTLKNRLGDSTSRRLQAAAEAFDLKPLIVAG